VAAATLYSAGMADGPRAVILAAGQGTRMKSATPKVLHPLGGRRIIDWSVDAATEATGQPPIVVIGPAHEAVAAHLGDRASTAVQAQPLGSGDALRSVPEELRSDGPVLVSYGDVPLLRAATLRDLLAHRERTGAACVLLTMLPDDPTGFGRILRGPDGRVERIVEQRDLPDPATAPRESNAGVYAFDGARLWPALDRLTADNAQGEHYLTDVVPLLGGLVEALAVADLAETIGINDRAQLAAAERAVRERTLGALLEAGVTIEDPATTYVDATVAIGADTVIRPMSVIRGGTTIGSGCEIGPAAVIEDSELADSVTVGPYCRIRPNTVLESGVSLGTHAEVKNSRIGPGSRVNHFSCVLDSDVGRDVNVGAGTVTCNFDGRAKHRTTIGDAVFIGSNSTLVAPVSIADNAYIAAASVITGDVPAGALAVGRARQRNIEGWAARRRQSRAGSS
jgi:bifunctional UDP-N-acetylglucosamine pyrophosphorylase/glucosamine-1-phosphate N-acetyltransferase